MSGFEKELPCRAQCDGVGIEWCLTNVDSFHNNWVIWRLCVRDGGEWTGTGKLGGSPDPEALSITDNNTLLIHQVTVFGYHNVLATCSILDDSNATVCNSTAIKIQVIGTFASDTNMQARYNNYVNIYRCSGSDTSNDTGPIPSCLVWLPGQCWSVL